jgi:hypothetical protein
MSGTRLRRAVAALRRASTQVDVPGTPRSLALDAVEPGGDTVRVSWSFVDPEVRPEDRVPHGCRLRGLLEVATAPGPPDALARSWWVEVQLAAGRRYRSQVDADWEPGAPVVRRVWQVDEAWEALLAHLGRYGADVRVVGGEIRVVARDVETTYRIDPDEWAAFLTGPEALAPSGGSDIVPAGVPLVDGLPLWALDELAEAAGAWGPVVGLVDGRIVGLPARDGNGSSDLDGPRSGAEG